MELKQGDLSVTEYAAKFVELEKLYPHYSEATTEFSKCIKFDNEVFLEIKKAIEYQQIRKFPELVNSCRIYEDDNKAHYKIISEMRGNQHHNSGKPYNSPSNKGKQIATEGKRSSGKGAPTDVVCYKYGKPGHKSYACIGEVKSCFCCGKAGHEIVDCRHKADVCLNCGEEGHINNQCQKPK